MKKVLLIIVIICGGMAAMAQDLDTVNTGTRANGRDGDPLRTAFTKVNAAISALNDLLTDYENGESLSLLSPMLADTVYHVVFGLGSGQIADTAVFAANAKCGSWKNNSSDTVIVASLWGILDSALVDASVTVQVSWADTLNAVISTNLNASAFTIDNEAVGNTDTSFANAKIPPGAIVKGTVGAVTLGAKPKYLQFQIDCYKIPKY
jgi:hypothetical protein